MISLETLAELLKRPGYSQNGLAEALGKTPPVVSRILAGTRQIKASEIPKIEEYLGVGVVTGAKEENAFFLALGQAVEGWNKVEGSLEWLVCQFMVSPPDTTITRTQAAALFQAIPSAREKIQAADLICLEALHQHRNEADAWRSLSQRLNTASRRRQTHLKIMIMGEEHEDFDSFYGFAHIVGGPRYSPNVSSETLREDAKLFTELSVDIWDFAETSDRLKLKDRRGHANRID
jgi:transcriptional regulator with XRE-family HTH domain